MAGTLSRHPPPTPLCLPSWHPLAPGKGGTSTIQVHQVVPPSSVPVRTPLAGSGPKNPTDPPCGPSPALSPRLPAPPAAPKGPECPTWPPEAFPASHFLAVGRQMGDPPPPPPQRRGCLQLLSRQPDLGARGSAGPGVGAHRAWRGMVVPSARFPARLRACAAAGGLHACPLGIVHPGASLRARHTAGSANTC